MGLHSRLGAFAALCCALALQTGCASMSDETHPTSPKDNPLVAMYGPQEPHWLAQPENIKALSRELISLGIAEDPAPTDNRITLPEYTLAPILWSNKNGYMISRYYVTPAYFYSAKLNPARHSIPPAGVYRYISHYSANNRCDETAAQREAETSGENDFVFGCGILRFEKVSVNIDSDYIFINYTSAYAYKHFKRTVSIKEIRKGSSTVIARSYNCFVGTWQLPTSWCLWSNDDVLDLIKIGGD